MSELGKIYEVDFNRGYKCSYPVVYKNNTYYYCKEFGTDRLKIFCEATVYTLEEYKDKIEINGLKGCYLVFVDCKENYFFNELKFNSFEYKYESLKRQKTKIEKAIADQEMQMKTLVVSIKKNKEKLNNIEEEIKKTLKLAALQQEELDKREK